MKYNKYYANFMYTAGIGKRKKKYYYIIIYLIIFINFNNMPKTFLFFF